MEKRIGISGWTYAPWRGVFYPSDLPQRCELAYASRQISSIEINGTHYGLQTPKSFLKWRDETPEGFVFSVKAHRYITHLRRLNEVEAPIANFLASGLLALEEKLGPILWQFPPSFEFSAALMRPFLKNLPRTTKEAARLARDHDASLRSGAWLDVKEERRMRHAVEIRHASFLTEEFFDMLHRNEVAFVFADTAHRWPYAEDTTSDFVYLRLHGDEKLYESGYTEEALKDWTARLKCWEKGKVRAGAPRVTSLKPQAATHAYVYFDNDIKVKAPRDARRLAEMTRSVWTPQPMEFPRRRRKSVVT